MVESNVDQGSNRMGSVRRWVLVVMVLTAGGLGVACEPDPTRCDGSPATVLGTNGNDTLNGTLGDDVIAGQAGNDTINGFGGNDRLCGGKGFDTIRGGDNQDFLDGNADTDTLDGGAGIDTVSYQTSDFGVVVDLQRGDGGDLDVLRNLEDAVGSPRNDFLVGDDFDNRLVGLGGDDTLTGRGGNDVLADQGSDVTAKNWFFGGPGNDVLYGSGANDIAGYHAAQVSSIWVNLGSGLAFGEGDDLLSAIDGVTGTEGNDTLQGDSRANSFEGRGGDDSIRGAGGNDVINGGADRDVASWAGLATPVDANLATGQATGDGVDTLIAVEDLTGGNGNDTLTGDPGPNIIDGSNGNDTCTGGGGLDTFFRCP